MTTIGKKEGIKFRIAGKANPFIIGVGYAALAGLGLLLLGLLLNKLGNPSGSLLCMIGFISFFSTFFFMLLNSGGRFIQERELTDWVLRLMMKELK